MLAHDDQPGTPTVGDRSNPAVTELQMVVEAGEGPAESPVQPRINMHRKIVKYAAFTGQYPVG
ncbi:hypothetical protein [Streptomyces mirabilis]|uniref:hypothetical protein n=1 Tax=Streptomyces mirabilis TaxID=68239 RepID=UPI0036D03FA2